MAFLLTLVLSSIGIHWRLLRSENWIACAYDVLKRQVNLFKF